MIRLVNGELRKLATSKTLLGFALLGIAMSVANVLIITVASGANLDSRGEKTEALANMSVILLLVGAVVAAGEYRHRTAATSALYARAGRSALFVARLVAYALAGLVIGALMMTASVGLGLRLLEGQPGAPLSTGYVTDVVVGCLVASVASVLIGAAIGAILRSQVISVVAIVLLMFVGNPFLARINDTAPYLTPFGANDVLSRAKFDVSVSPSEALPILLAWTMGLIMLAIVSERYRDLA